MTQENSDYEEDPDQIGYFKDANSYYNLKTAEWKETELWNKITEDTTMQDHPWLDWAT